MEKLGRKGFYRNIGIDTVATMVNDLITVGAMPISIAMHAAVGDAEWFADAERSAALAAGFAEACLQSNAVWGGGETPTLRGIVNPDTIVLAGSALGRIRPKSLRITGNVREGDAILFLASSGVQTNGLTLCSHRSPTGCPPVISLPSRAMAAPTAKSFSTPSIIYVRYLAALQSAGLNPHYAVHVTGHGWRSSHARPQ